MNKSTNATYPHQVDTEYKIIDSFVRKFIQKFNAISGKEISPTRFRKTLPFVRSAIHDLRILFEGLHFDKSLNEAYFFKHVKPLIYSYLISEVELSRIFLNKPETAEQPDATYYTPFIAEYQGFFADNNFHYRYYKSQSTELDDVLFVRHEDISLVTIDYSVLSDPSFSTMLDFVFAKFIAFERVQEILKNKITSSADIQAAKTDSVNITDQSLKWTGEGINLVEIAYGIWLTGQINNGNATITEIILWLEKHFGINIGRPYRRWTEISQRKVVSPTKYMDQMTNVINQRINDELSMKKKQRPP